MFDNVGHNLDEAPEGLALSGWGWTGLETDFGDDEGLGYYCCKGFGHGAEY